MQARFSFLAIITIACGSTDNVVLNAQANKRLNNAEKELAKAFEHARNTAERRSHKQEL